MKENCPVEHISNTEKIVGEDHLKLIENNIIYVIVKGEQTTVLAYTIKRVIYDLIDSLSGNIKFLINLNKAGKSSPEARKIWKELSEHVKTEKVAVFGMHPVAKVMASFVMDVASKKEMQFFRNREEALIWLNNIQNL